MNISFVILTWNSEKYITKCLQSYCNALSAEGLNAEFIIIDNGSTDNTLKILHNEIPLRLLDKYKIRIINFKKNLGTTISRNVGLKKSEGEYIVICDSDTEFLSGEWRDAIGFILKNADAGILAPLIVFDDGSFQNSVKRFPTVSDKILKILKIFFGFKFKDDDFYNDLDLYSQREVDTATSAFWLMKKSILSEVGFLDEKIFYSPEDIDYCLRAWKKGKKVIFYPQLKIIHHGQQLSHKKPFSKQSFSHLGGLFYYFFKHRYFVSRRRLYERING